MRKPCNESKRKRKIRAFILTHPLMPYRTLSGHFLTTDAMRVLICCIYDNDDAFYHNFTSNVSHLDAYLGEGKCRKPMEHTEMYHAVKYLEKIGLIENVQGDEKKFTFRATYECMSYFQLKRKALTHRAFNSILLPVIISIITAMIMCFINV